MPRAEKPIRADNRKAHRVLVATRHATRGPLALACTEQAGVRRYEQCAVRRIDTKSMYVNRAGIDLHDRPGLGAAIAATRDCRHDKQPRDAPHR